MNLRFNIVNSVTECDDNDNDRMEFWLYTRFERLDQLDTYYDVSNQVECIELCLDNEDCAAFLFEVRSVVLISCTLYSQSSRYGDDPFKVESDENSVSGVRCNFDFPAKPKRSSNGFYPPLGMKN